MGKVITIAQQKGGSGKTTLAVNLAVAFCRMGHSVALLDTDPQGSLGRWFLARRARMAAPLITLRLKQQKRYMKRFPTMNGSDASARPAGKVLSKRMAVSLLPTFPQLSTNSFRNAV